MVTAQKVILQVPKPLLVRADQLAGKLRTNRSNLIRMALKEKIERWEQERFEAELREDYSALSELRLREYLDFESVVSEMHATEPTEPAVVR